MTLGSFRVIAAGRAHGWPLLAWRATWLAAMALVSACQDIGVGDPCIPELEYEPGFGGFSKDEVSVESRSFQCETRLCLVNKFQGRVSCPYGQDDLGQCKSPDGDAEIAVLVPPQLVSRPPSAAVYCSCRCDGPTSDSPYCECPRGFTCADLIPNIQLGEDQLIGGYCVKNGTDLNSAKLDEKECEPADAQCASP
jgi:hypothetical protein